MAVNIILGIKVAHGPIKRHKLENYNLNEKIIAVKEEAAKATGLAADVLEVIYHGKVLNDESHLKDHGVKSGEMIHVLKKPEPPPKPAAHPEIMTVDQLVAAIRFFGSSMTSPAWVQCEQVINDPALMDEIFEAIPEVENDQVALAVLQSPDLIDLLRNVTFARSLAEEKPALIAAVKQLVHIINRSLLSSNAAYAFSLENLSEEEDEEDDEFDYETLDTRRSARITNQQLAAALRAATRSRGAASSAGRSGMNMPRLATPEEYLLSDPPQGTSRNSPGRAIITSDMFSSALSQAMTSVPTPSTPSSTSNNSTASSTNNDSFGSRMNDPFRTDLYVTQLQTMREMGLTNESVNMRALLVSDGDVMSAVDLIINGVIED